MSDTITRPAHAPPAAIRALTETVRSRVITASDPDYDDARAVYNAMHDRKPHAVVQCTDSADVMTVIAAARGSGVDLAIRGRGPQRSRIRHRGRRAGQRPVANEGRAGRPGQEGRPGRGGATLGDVDHATYPFGLAAPSGVVSTTGVAGLTLGGGIGYLTRSVGLCIDNLLSADVVLADGRQVTASDYQTRICFGHCAAVAATSVSSPASSSSSTRSVTSCAAHCSTTSTMPRPFWSATARTLTRHPSSSDASSAGRSRLRCRSSPRTGSGICSACWSRARTVPISRPSACSGHCATPPR
jgi:hypothetical protein